MEKRKRQRSVRRLTCELQVGDERFQAIVRDISPKGLFLQTRARPPEDSVVEVVFPAEAGRPEIRVEAGVARHRAVPPRLQAAVQSGLGLELLSPSPEFEALAAQGVGDEAEAEVAPQAADDQRVRTYRVRVKQRGRANARVLTIRCGNPAAARARALAQAGRDWAIADIQEV